MPAFNNRPLKSEKKEIEDIRASLKSPLEGCKRFSDLPISFKTKAGLEQSHFTDMTDIQQYVLPHALNGLDILATAKTGSGKTLAFIVPVLENLFLQSWTQQDGLGALILSPTRELAVQIFDVLREVGFKHDFSAGLVIGGKDVKAERNAIGRMNILVATPGRLLQHLDQSCTLDCSNLRILVLDEADRILDMGFSKTLDEILRALPKGRQTILFSATRSSSVDSLARLSLCNPMELSTYKTSEPHTPKSLRQYTLVSELEAKIEHLYSFIKANLKSKTIVFFSSCKQVRFIYESFCKLHPGVPLISLHGKQKQYQRLNAFNEFCKKTHAVLICTDVAARGLDFPSVDWVVQADCPEDAETYIHRVGRTARYSEAGRALLIRLPSEACFMGLLKPFDITIDVLDAADPLVKTKGNVTLALQSICSQNQDIKYLAQKALISYVRSVYLQKNKKVFQVGALDIQKLAKSYGLYNVPIVKFLPKSGIKNQSRELLNLMTSSLDKSAAPASRSLSEK